MLTNVIRYPWCGIIGVECLGERDEKGLFWLVSETLMLSILFCAE